MKYLKSGLLLASLAIIFVGTVAFSQKTQWPKAPAYTNPTPGEMPIVASYAFYDTAFMTPPRYKELREAGFNITRQGLTEAEIDKSIAAMEGSGVMMMLAEWNIARAGRAEYLINKYKNNPLVCCYFVKDEPSAADFSDVKSLTSRITNTDSKKPAYTNLFGATSPSQLKAPDYKSYLTEFINTVNPVLLSFDAYPIVLEKGQPVIADYFYPTIEEVYKISKESGRPFWGYVVSVKHLSYPKPSKENLRFQIFSLLGYGAQGLNYFTYMLPGFDKGVGKFSDAPLDFEGNRTATWYMVRDVNKEVRALQKYFLSAEVLSVAHTGSRIPQGTERLRSVPAPFDWITSDGPGIQVSHLRNGGQEYVLFVNRDLTHSQKVRYSKRSPITRIDSKGKEKKDNGNSVTLDAGGYALFRLS